MPHTVEMHENRHPETRAYGLHQNRNPWRDAPAWAIEIGAALHHIITRQETIMATLDDVLADVTAESDRLDSISALLSGLKQQLADALAGTTLPPAVQAKVDAIFTAAETNKGKIDAALNQNAPPPPTT